MANATDILQRLWSLEKRNQKDALAATAAGPHLLPCLQVTGASLALLWELIHARAAPTEEERGRIWLGVRAWQSIAAALRLALSGYYQQALLIQRDVFEHTQLLDLFNRCPEQYPVWQTCSPEQRWAQFSPGRIRGRLKHLDGRNHEWRSETYHLFSRFSAHPDPGAWRVVSVRGMLQPGPFFHESKARDCLFELSVWVVAVTCHLLEFMPSTPSAGSERQEFLALAREWYQAYEGSLRRKKLDGELDALIHRGAGADS